MGRPETGPAPWTAPAIDAASHGAIAFTQIYYEAYDEPTRRATELPKLFMPDAKVLWNGTLVPADPASLATFLNGLPLSRHDVQTIDCHPVHALDADAGPSPDLIVNITGSVLFGPAVVTQGSTNRLPPQDHPRKFHEMFLLRAIEQGQGLQPKYAVKSSNFRFIG